MPNAITVARVGLVPVLVWLLAVRDFQHALLVFTLAGVSDALDGFIAKRFGAQSQFGAVLDPLADKVLLVSAYVMLARLSLIPTWLVMAVVARDLLIVAGYLLYVSAAGLVQMRPSLLSKANTTLQILLAAVVLAKQALGGPFAGAVAPLIVAVTVSTVASGVHYFWQWAVMRTIVPVRTGRL